MPVIDEDGRVVGCLFRELRDTGNYMKVFMVVDFDIHKIKMYQPECEVRSKGGGW